MSEGDGRNRLCEYEHEMSILSQLEGAEKTIEALQQQLEQYDQDRTAAQQLWGEECEECIKLQQEIEQLQDEYQSMVKTNRNKIEQLQAQVAQYREAVEVLETVTEHLENCYGRNTPDTEKAREALAAIGEIGGKEDA